jgi:predicted alpha/beta hydrolase
MMPSDKKTALVTGANRGIGFAVAVVPLSIQVLGYVPAEKLGWGADLPAGVAQQWVRWCSRPGYVANGFGKEISQHWYDELIMPALWLYAEDDPIVTPANVDNFLRVCPALDPERKSLRPADYGLSRIGHMGLFRRQGSSLWPIVAEWLAKQNVAVFAHGAN